MEQKGKGRQEKSEGSKGKKGRRERTLFSRTLRKWPKFIDDLRTILRQFSDLTTIL